jgi:hypothetical protein
MRVVKLSSLRNGSISIHEIACAKYSVVLIECNENSQDPKRNRSTINTPIKNGKRIRHASRKAINVHTSPAYPSVPSGHEFALLWLCALAQWHHCQNPSCSGSIRTSNPTNNPERFQLPKPHQARAARNVASQRALRESSTVKAIVGWKQRSVSQVPQLPVVVPAGWSPVRFKIVASGSIADQIEERDCIKSQYCRLSILWALHFASWLPPSRARSDISAFAWDHDAERQQ